MIQCLLNIKQIRGIEYGKRNIDLNEISDGLSIQPMIWSGQIAGSEGCSVCCHGMGKSILLDPLDVHRICTYFRIPV